MKFDQALQDAIKARFNPRKPLFMTRTKMFVQYQSAQWSQACHGILIIYSYNDSYYITVLNILKFEIEFDMEIYSNFMAYAKFMGELQSFVFLLPCKTQFYQSMMALQSKQELTEIKLFLEQLLNNSVEFRNLDFFQQEDVRELILAAQINEELLQENLRFKREVEIQIREYLQKIKSFEKKKNVSGFKAYGLGREQMKRQAEEIQYAKNQRKQQTVEILKKIYRQAKMQ